MTAAAAHVTIAAMAPGTPQRLQVIGRAFGEGGWKTASRRERELAASTLDSQGECQGTQARSSGPDDRGSTPWFRVAPFRDDLSLV